MDVIKTVAEAELILRAELMIHFRQEVAVVNRVGIKTRCNRRPLVAGRGKPRVDSVHVYGRDGDEAALIQPPLLEVGEVESAVMYERAAETRAILRLGGRKLAVGKRVGCVETLIAQVTIQV